MGKVFFISDMHFNHTNIIKYCNRPFSDVHEMNETIINNWNNRVSEKDIIYVLGDVGLFRPLTQENVRDIITRLKGKKYLICGNHDRRMKPNWWVETGFVEAVNHPVVFRKQYVLSHEPVSRGSFTKYINIHGHSHNKQIDSDSYINVCVECVGYTPISLQEIEKIVQKSKGGLHDSV